MDRRIRRLDDRTEQFLFSPDFSITHYHPSCAHITKKNPVFTGIVTVDRYTCARLTEEQRQYVATFDLKFKFCNVNLVFIGLLNIKLKCASENFEFPAFQVI